MLDDWNMQGTQKWLVDYLAPYGTYVIKNFANMEVYLQPGAPPSRRDVPKAEINSYQFQWVIAEAPNGHGYFIVKAAEQDQVLQAVSYGPDVVVDDLDQSRSNRRQIWLFETVN
ncbi:hypothetical protein K4569_00100 [Bacillus bingmayongensis]|nr:hypothetical protein [Bacillus bingmayongensis]